MASSKPTATLVVLAAGMGSRYQGKKQIDPMISSGESIIDYSLYDALQAGFTKVVFVVNHYFDETIQKYFTDILEERGIDVHFVAQKTDSHVPEAFHALIEKRVKPWGTGHAVLMAQKYVNEPFVVINADDFYGRAAYQEMSDAIRNSQITSQIFGMVGYPIEATLSQSGSVSRGICSFDKDHYLNTITERTQILKKGDTIIYEDGSGTHFLEENTVVSMNFWAFHPAIFEQLESLFIVFLEKNKEDLDQEFYLPEAIDALIKENKVKVKIEVSTDQWFGVTYPEDKPVVTEKIKELIAQKKYPNPLWKQNHSMDVTAILETFFELNDNQAFSTTVIKDGHINDTFFVEITSEKAATERYILQRINTTVFKKPEVIMDSMNAIADHLSENNYPKVILKPIPNKSNPFLSYDQDGNPWRLLPYVPASVCLKKVESPEQAFEAAKTFSEFYLDLFGMDLDKIQPAIPDFLDFESRIVAFKTALANADQNRKQTAKKELDFLIQHLELPNHFIALQKSGKLPNRLIHADPKISNILFDTTQTRGLCIIDLDTVMPGTLLYDYGDMIRSYTNTKAEDDPEESGIFNAAIHEAVTNGFLYHIRDHLTQTELENLSYSAQVVVYIQGLRFMTDYLNGDTYYKTDYPKQNLNRAKNQIHLLQALLNR